MKKKWMIILLVILIAVGIGISNNLSVKRANIELMNFQTDVEAILNTYEFDYELEVYRKSEGDILTAKLINTNFEDLDRELQYYIVKDYYDFINSKKYESVDSNLLVETSNEINRFNIANTNLEKNGFTHFLSNFAEGGDKNIFKSNMTQSVGNEKIDSSNTKPISTTESSDPSRSWVNKDPSEWTKEEEEWAKKSIEWQLENQDKN